MKISRNQVDTTITKTIYNALQGILNESIKGLASDLKVQFNPELNDERTIHFDVISSKQTLKYSISLQRKRQASEKEETTEAPPTPPPQTKLSTKASKAK